MLSCIRNFRNSMKMKMSLTLKWLFLLLLFLCHHVNSGSIVECLPGFEGPLPFKLETGYIGIGEKEELQMFYYFIESENNPQEDPLLIWLTGGPGCSSLCGLLFEIGPVTIKIEAYNGTIPSLVSTPYSWTKMTNILFLDQPVGSGFSYKRTPNINKSSDTIEVGRIYEFLHKWLGQHPEFFSNPFYVAGDSYSGKTVPALVQEISKGNYLCCKPLLNLQGYVLGNPITYPELERNHRIPHAHGMAFISDELYESLKTTCNGNYENVDSHNTECLKFVGNYRKNVQKLYIFNTLVPDCDQTSPDCYFYKNTLLTIWANDERVREALQVDKGSIREWVRCNRSIPYDKNIQSSIPYHINNSISGYRSLIYNFYETEGLKKKDRIVMKVNKIRNGDHDMVVPFLSTQAWIRSMNYSIIDDWRPWMRNDQIAGYTRTYANKMTFATLKGCGHTAEYKPNEAFIMFQRWINDQPL